MEIFAIILGIMGALNIIMAGVGLLVHSKNRDAIRLRFIMANLIVGVLVLYVAVQA